MFWSNIETCTKNNLCSFASQLSLLIEFKVTISQLENGGRRKRSVGDRPGQDTTRGFTHPTNIGSLGLTEIEPRESAWK